MQLENNKFADYLSKSFVLIKILYFTSYYININHFIVQFFEILVYLNKI